MALITTNKPFGKPTKPSAFRRLSMGSWSAPNDPTIYGVLEVNVERALKYLEDLRTKTTERVTITHYIGRVFAEVLKHHPELNCEIRFGKFYPKMSIDLSFQVAIEETESDPAHDGKKRATHRHDLSAGLVERADQMSVVEIAQALNASARTIRSQNDPAFAGIKRLSAIIPGFMQTFSVSALKWVTSTLNLWSPLLGIPRNAFGSMMITNVGSLGLDFALPSLFPPAGVSCILAVGAIYKAPIYETDADGNVVKTKLERFVRLCGAFDHRYLDGIHGARIARDIRRFMEHPELWA